MDWVGGAKESKVNPWQTTSNFAAELIKHTCRIPGSCRICLHDQLPKGIIVPLLLDAIVPCLFPKPIKNMTF